jgi:hypothetical protein
MGRSLMLRLLMALDCASFDGAWWRLKALDGA